MFIFHWKHSASRLRLSLVGVTFLACGDVVGPLRTHRKLKFWIWNWFLMRFLRWTYLSLCMDVNNECWINALNLNDMFLYRNPTVHTALFSFIVSQSNRAELLLWRVISRLQHNFCIQFNSELVRPLQNEHPPLTELPLTHIAIDTRTHTPAKRPRCDNNREQKKKRPKARRKIHVYLMGLICRLESGARGADPVPWETGNGWYIGTISPRKLSYLLGCWRVRLVFLFFSFIFSIRSAVRWCVPAWAGGAWCRAEARLTTKL